MSSGGTTDRLPHSVGVYELLKDTYNGFPLWNSITKQRYLYRCTDGKWQVADCVGSDSPLIKSTAAMTSPLDDEACWQYQHEGEWKSDDTLSVRVYNKGDL